MARRCEVKDVLTYAIIFYIVFRMCSTFYECGRRSAHRKRDNDLHDKN